MRTLISTLLSIVIRLLIRSVIRTVFTIVPNRYVDDGKLLVLFFTENPMSYAWRGSTIRRMMYLFSSESVEVLDFTHAAASLFISGTYMARGRLKPTDRPQNERATNPRTSVRPTFLF